MLILWCSRIILLQKKLAKFHFHNPWGKVRFWICSSQNSDHIAYRGFYFMLIIKVTILFTGNWNIDKKSETCEKICKSTFSSQNLREFFYIVEKKLFVKEWRLQTLINRNVAAIIESLLWERPPNKENWLEFYDIIGGLDFPGLKSHSKHVNSQSYLGDWVKNQS